MKNENKIILDLCGGTGSWSRPYEKAGYKVYNITLPEFDVKEFQIDEAAGTLIFPRQPEANWPHPLIVNINQVYGILAAPPCTEFSMARNGCKKPRDFVGAMEVVEACLQVIWAVRARSSSMKFWALENPTAHLRKFLGIPPFWFYQWEFGTPFYKRTDIWGYYNRPRKTYRVRPKGHSRDKALKLWDNPPLEQFRGMPIGKARAAWRAITPPKFAQAFYKANR